MTQRGGQISRYFTQDGLRVDGGTRGSRGNGGRGKWPRGARWARGGAGPAQVAAHWALAEAGPDRERAPSEHLQQPTVTQAESSLLGLLRGRTWNTRGTRTRSPGGGARAEDT